MDNPTVAILMAVSGIVGIAANKLVEWALTRSKTQYEQTQQQRKDTLTEYQDLFQRQNERIAVLEKRHDECEHRNDECEKRSVSLEVKHQRNLSRIEYLEEALERANIPFRKSPPDEDGIHTPGGE